MTPYYQDEWTAIYHGDCMEVMGTLESGSAEIAVTSPPYNLVLEWSGTGELKNSSWKAFAEKKRRWYEDSKPEPLYQRDQIAVINELLRVCKSSVFYNHKVRYAWKRRNRIYHPMEWVGQFPIWMEIIWDRDGGPGRNTNRYMMADERIYMIRRPRVWNGAPGLTNVWKVRPERESEHVCAFPVEIPLRCILPTTSKGDVVIDPYMGSGTTLLAAKNTGRKSIGIDSDERCCEMAVNGLLRQESLAL